MQLQVCIFVAKVAELSFKGKNTEHLGGAMIRKI